MAKIRWHKCGAYPFARYGLIYGSDDMRAFCVKNGLDFDEYVVGQVSALGTSVFVYVDRRKTAELEYSTLVHESVHVWQYIKKKAGEIGYSEEAEAYGIESIFSDLLSDMQRLSQ